MQNTSVDDADPFIASRVPDGSAASPCSVLLRKALVCRQPQTAEPIIDIHQHLGYSGRPDDVLLAHQRALGATTTILLPAGRSVTPRRRTGGSERLCRRRRSATKPAIALPGRMRRSSVRRERGAGCRRRHEEIERYLEARRGAHCRAEVRRGVRFAGDAAHLRAGARPSSARADALAIQDVQPWVRAIPQDAREIPDCELSRPRPDVVGEHRQEPRRPVGALSEGSGHARRPDGSLPERLPEHVRRPLRRLGPQRADTGRRLHARFPDASPEQAGLRQRLQRPRGRRPEMSGRPDDRRHSTVGSYQEHRTEAAARQRLSAPGISKGSRGSRGSGALEDHRGSGRFHGVPRPLRSLLA